MSELYYFIATKTTYDVAVPSQLPTWQDLNRATSNAFRGLVGGWVQAGDLKVRTTATPPPNHLLCDGSTVNRIDFPQLAEALGIDEAETTFTLPNFIGTTPEVAPTAPPQTVDEGGTVSTGGTVSEPTSPGQTGGTVGGNIPSGGRPGKLMELDEA